MKMLGRFESPGCCPGSRAGWYRTRRAYGPDCSGAVTDARRAKRAEQRQVAREVDRALGDYNVQRPIVGFGGLGSNVR